MAQAIKSRSAGRRRNAFGWLTKKRETYHRDVKAERAEFVHKAKAKKAREKEDQRERQRSLLEELEARAYDRGAADKREGWKTSAQLKPGLTPYRLDLMVRSEYEKAFGKAKARALVKKAYEAGYRENPAVSAAQYRLAQAVLSGTARETRMSKKVAREIVDRTPARLRSKYSRNPAMEFSTEYHLGYNLGQVDRQAAQLRKTPGELRATFDANFRLSPTARWESFEQAYQAGYGIGSGDKGQGNPNEVIKTGYVELKSSERGVPSKKVRVRSADQASAAVRAYIDTYGLGASNWTGGDIRESSGKLIGRVSYNGRVWTPDGLLLQDIDGGFPVPESRRVKFNPEPSDAEPDNEDYRQAKKIAELFHGRPVKETITVTEQIREHDWLWRIGPLISLKVRTLTKRNATFPFHQDEKNMVHLFCSPDGRQFYLRGGDQEIDLKALGMGPGTDWFRDQMLIGEAKEITYRDKKKFHRFALTEYFHKLGEVSNEKPMLAYDALAKKLSILGGQYRVETEDLVDGMSPGIVN